MEEPCGFLDDDVPHLASVTGRRVASEVVVPVGDGNQPSACSDNLQWAMKALSMFIGNCLVAGAVDDEKWRRAGSNVSQWTRGAQLFDMRTRIAADQRCNRGWSIDLHGPARSQQIGWSTDGDDGLHVGSNDIVHAVVARCHEARHRRQMPTGGVSPRPNAVGIDSEDRVGWNAAI